MTTKEKVLKMLLDHKNTTLSGTAMAKEIGVSRNTVWKVIQDLQAYGYTIDSIPSKGYQLIEYTDQVDPFLIEYLLADFSKFKVSYYPEVSSTNDLARQDLLDFPDQDTLVIASEQSSGRGRRGRAFYSGLSHGLYMSLGIRPNTNDLKEIPIYTLLTAVACLQAFKPYIEDSLQVKWVNDLFYQGRKVAGILSEMVTHLENYDVPSIVIGIGINLAGQFSKAQQEIQDVAGTIFGEEIPEDFNVNELIVRFLKYFNSYQNQLPQKDFLEIYKEQLLGLNQEINYQIGQEIHTGIIRGINDEGHLLIEDDDYQIKALYGQEIHFSSSQFLDK